MIVITQAHQPFLQFPCEGSVMKLFDTQKLDGQLMYKKPGLIGRAVLSLCDNVLLEVQCR